jgi:peptide/nickel transport system permease protein
VTLYLVRRLALALGVALAVLVAMASLVRFIPGDAATVILGHRATPELVAEVRTQMGLDLPVYQQVWEFLTRAVQGDLGHALFTDRPVTSMIADVLPHTLVLALSSMVIAVFLAIPLGVLAAARPNSLLDRALGLLSISAISIPSLVGALFLLIVLGVEFELFPILGAGSFSDPLEYLRHLVLPSLAIAIGWAGYLARLLRASLIEVLGANYIRAARALGIRERLIFFQYALKNAFIPTMAVVGFGLATLTGGTVFVEVIFTRPGIGTLFYQAIQTRNYPIVQGTAIVVALLFIGINLLVDLAYRFVDPRVRVEMTRGA